MTACPLKPLNAMEELCVLHRSPLLLSPLLRRGLGVEDATALAHNATLLYYAMRPYDKAISSPRAVLDRLSLKEIADHCRRLEERGEEEGP